MGLNYYYDIKRHLVCVPYSRENLNKMADDLGIGRHWYHAGKYPHYDIPLKMIDLVSKRAKLVSSRDILKIIKKKYG